VKNLIFCCVLFSLAACSTASAPAESPPPATEADSVCIEIAHTCHEYEAFSAKAKDCHEKGHSKKTTEEQCQAMRAECLDECTKAAEAARGQGATGESAPAEPGHDHPAGTDSKHAH
jgi:hypothetical protein